MKIIGYAYEADVHCVRCAVKRFDKFGSVKLGTRDENGIRTDARDREGNTIHPMFSTDEQLDPEFCGDCRGEL